MASYKLKYKILGNKFVKFIKVNGKFVFSTEEIGIKEFLFKLSQNNVDIWCCFNEITDDIVKNELNNEKETDNTATYSKVTSQLITAGTLNNVTDAVDLETKNVTNISVTLITDNTVSKNLYEKYN